MATNFPTTESRIRFNIDGGVYTIKQLENIIAAAKADIKENDLEPIFLINEEDGDALYQQWGNNCVSRFVP